MSDIVTNRPYVDGKPIEGPEPFMDRMTLVEGYKIGAIDKMHYQTSGWSMKQIVHLFEFRELFPIDFSTDKATTYPNGVEEFPRLKPQKEFRRRKGLGKRIIEMIRNERGDL